MKKKNSPKCFSLILSILFFSWKNEKGKKLPKLFWIRSKETSNKNHSPPWKKWKGKNSLN